MTPAFDRFITPARVHPAIWRVLAGMVAIVASYVALLFTITRLFAPLPFDGEDDPRWTLFVLFTFGGLAIGTKLAALLWHKRGPRTLIGPLRYAISDFCRAAGIILVPSLLLLGFAFGTSTPGLAPDIWLQLLPLTLLGLLVQTGAEEVVFRGYLQQQLASRFRSPIIWMVLPSLAFGALHFDPETMGGNVWLVVAATSLFGLIAADLTARTGTLGAAWGLHFGNNLIAIAIISPPGPLDGLSLRLWPFLASDEGTMRSLLLADMAGLLILWLPLRWFLRR